MRRLFTLRSRATRPFAVLIAAAVLVTGSPNLVAASTLVDRASMALVLDYGIKADLSYTYGTITAEQRITLTNISGSAISKLNLSVMPRAFGELVSIGSFTVDGRATSAAWSNNANLVLQLGKNVADGATAVVRLTFKVRASSTIGTSLEGRLSKANGIMQVSHWFPVVSTGHGMRYPGDSQYTRTATKIRLQLHTDSSTIKVAAPGRVVSSSSRDHVFELDNARDFAFAASPSYIRATGTAAGVTIKVYATTASTTTTLALAKEMLVKFEAAYGQYQWPTFVIAQSGRSGSGNEYPGIVFLGKSVFSHRKVVAHEVSHQWWYAMVGNDQIGSPWLDEGLAEFSASYYFGTFTSYRSSLPVNTSSGSFPNIPAPLTSLDPDSYDQTVYFKAAAMLSGLRARMGSAAFFGAMRELFATNRNGIMTTSEFVAVMLDHGAPQAYLASFLEL